MSSQRQKLLMEEIAKMRQLFPKDHPRFQILGANIDELSAKFIIENGNGSQQQIKIYANFQDNATLPPFWSSDSELPILMELLEKMSTLIELPNQIQPRIGQQICQIYRTLCNHFGLTPLADDEQRNIEKVMQQKNEIKIGSAKEIGNNEDEKINEENDESNEEEGEENEEEEESDNEDVDDLLVDYEENAKKPKIEDEKGNQSGVPAEALAQIERASKKEMEKKSNNNNKGFNEIRRPENVSSSSVFASDRLMKEFKALFNCEGFKKGVFSAELFNDNLYEWHVKLMKVDEDSPLAEDLRKLENQGEPNHLLFHFVFPSSFPFEPPFVRLVSPYLSPFSGHLTRAGAVCMELLTKQGWSSAYSIESLIIQLAATLVAGEARVEFDNKCGLVYTLENARISYQNLVRVHGWNNNASTSSTTQK